MRGVLGSGVAAKHGVFWPAKISKGLNFDLPNRSTRVVVILGGGDEVGGLGGCFVLVTTVRSRMSTAW